MKSLAMLAFLAISSFVGVAQAQGMVYHHCANGRWGPGTCPPQGQVPQGHAQGITIVRPAQLTTVTPPVVTHYFVPAPRLIGPPNHYGEGIVYQGVQAPRLVVNIVPQRPATVYHVAPAAPVQVVTHSHDSHSAPRLCTSNKTWRLLNWPGHPDHNQYRCLPPEDQLDRDGRGSSTVSQNTSAPAQNTCQGTWSWKTLDWPGHPKHGQTGCFPSDAEIARDKAAKK